jgi:hypothetical protein
MSILKTSLALGFRCKPTLSPGGKALLRMCRRWTIIAMAASPVKAIADMIMARCIAGFIVVFLYIYIYVSVL